MGELVNYSVLHDEQKNKLKRSKLLAFKKQILFFVDIQKNIDPLNIKLMHVNFWIKCYDLSFDEISKDKGFNFE